MKIAVVGAGGVGGYFGGLLAKHGHDVHLIARGENLKALQNNGLSVSSPNGDFHTTIHATDTPSNVGVAEAVIVAVKGWQLHDAIPAISSLTGTDTLVLPLLNGVEATETLEQELSKGIVLNGLCGIIAKIDVPGKINHIAIDPFVKFGTTGNTPKADKLLSSLADTFNKIGVDAEIPQDIARAIWMKFLFIAPLSGITSVTRATIGAVRKNPETRDMLIQAIVEALAVGKALGVNLNADDLDKTLTMIDNAPTDGTTSMQRDVESGQPSELETQTGAIVRLGQQINTETPVNTFIYKALLPQEQAARKK